MTENTEAVLASLTARMDAQEELMRVRFDALTVLLNERLSNQEKALATATAAADKRFESVNEFRAQLDDVITGLMPRSESTARWSALSEKVDQAVTAAIERDAMMSRRLDMDTGRGSGIKDTWSYLFSAIAVIAAAITVVLSFRH
jgi:hypothetical protein